MESTVVLGAGAVGTATAYYLNRAGHEVTVIERQPAAGLETSWGNGGVIHASEIEPWSQPGMPVKILRWLGQEGAPLLLRTGAIPHMWRWGLQFARNCTPEKFRRHCETNLALALHSLRSLQEIRAETGIDYDHATRGVLKIYRSPEGLDASHRALGLLAPLGLEFEHADPARCVEIEPALGGTAPTLAGGLYFARDEVGDCNKFTQGLAAVTAANGVRFSYGTTVKGIAVEGGRVTGVETDKGRVPARRVVAALASFTAPLLRSLGLRVPIYPVKGLSITFPRGGWNGAPRLPVIDDSHLFGLVPIGDRLRISGSAEIDRFDTEPSPTRCEAIIANATRTFPGLAGALDRKRAVFWAGLRPVTPAGTPLIGRTRIEGLWLNAGHGHLGWTLSCGSGRVLADLVAGRDPGIALPDPQGVLVRH